MSTSNYVGSRIRGLEIVEKLEELIDFIKGQAPDLQVEMERELHQGQPIQTLQKFSFNLGESIALAYDLRLKLLEVLEGSQ